MGGLGILFIIIDYFFMFLLYIIVIQDSRVYFDIFINADNTIYSVSIPTNFSLLSFPDPFLYSTGLGTHDVIYFGKGVAEVESLRAIY